MLRYGAKRPVRTSMKMECGIDIPVKIVLIPANL